MPSTTETNKSKNVFLKMSKDISPYSFPNNRYYDAENITISSEGDNTFISLRNNVGNSLLFNVPNFNLITSGSVTYIFNSQNYSVQVNEENIIGLPQTYVNNPNYVVGYSCLKNDLIFITVTKNHNVNAIWYYDLKTNQLRLITIGKLNITLDNPVRKILQLEETENIKKVYFVDGENYLRYFDYNRDILLKQNQIIDSALSLHHFNSNCFVKEGGSFKVGLVCYYCTLGIRNGSFTSPFLISNLMSINNYNKGDRINSFVSRSVSINIYDIKTTLYDIIRIYRIHYDSEFAEPAITLIYENNINSENLSITDDYSRFLESISVQDFVSLYRINYIPKDIEIKDNRLVLFNVKTKNFDVDFDTRAYSFDSSRTCVLFSSSNNNYVIDGQNPDYSIPEHHDCINPSVKAETNYDRRINTGNTNQNYFKYIYQSDGITIGGEGPNLKYRINADYVRADEDQIDSIDFNKRILRDDSNRYQLNNIHKKSFKTDEVYRLGIRFKNIYGNYSFAKWIADVRIPNASMFPLTEIISNQLHRLQVTITVEFKTDLPEGIIGYELLICERKPHDCTILAQGHINTTINPPNDLGVLGNKSILFDSIMLNPVQCFVVNSQSNNKNLKFVHGNRLDPQRISPWSQSTGQKAYIPNAGFLNFYSTDIENISTYSKNLYLSFIGGYVCDLKNSLEIKNFNQKDALVYFFKGRNFLKSKTNSPSLADILGLGLTSEFKDLAEDGVLNQIEGLYGKKTYLNGFFSSLESIYDDVRRRSNGTKSICLSISDEETSILKSAEGILGSYLLINGYLFDTQDVNSLGPDFGIMPIVELKIKTENQYGGNTYSDRTQKSTYVQSSRFYHRDEKVAKSYGDVFVNYFNSVTNLINNPSELSQKYNIKQCVAYIAETQQNEDLREDSYNDFKSAIYDYKTDFETIHLKNKTYSRNLSIIKSFEKPYDFKSLSSFPYNVYISRGKSYGETEDSFLIFPTNNFITAEANNGYINAGAYFNDRIYVFQENAVSILNINPKILVADIEKNIIQQGTGKLLDSFNYISTSSGTLHQFSVKSTPYGLFYFDYNRKEIMQISNGLNKLFTQEGFISWVNNNPLLTTEDNPYKNKGVLTSFNPFLNKVYFRFFDEPEPNRIPENYVNRNYDLVYSFVLNGFESFTSNRRKGGFFSNDKFFDLSNDLRSFWFQNLNVFGKYYDKNNVSKITFVVNQNQFSKILDYLIYSSVVKKSNTEYPLETFTHIRVYNDYQDTGIVPINAKRKFREWRITIPREKNTRNRMRGLYFYVTLYYENNDNKSFQSSDIISSYTIFPASFV